MNSADDLLTVHWGKALTPENCLQSAKCLGYPIHFKHISFDCIYITYIYIYVQYGTYLIFTYIANSSSIPPSFHLPTATLFGVLPRLGLVEVGLFLGVHGISARAQR
jgi:hypothetical protein